MTFLSPTFLFLFLPVFLVVYTLFRQEWRGLVLLAASLVFIAFQSKFYAAFYVGYLLVNYLFGRWLEKARDEDKSRKWALAISVMINVLLLVGFKLLLQYKADILAWNPGDAFGLNRWLRAFALPIGFSYTAFQIIAYLIDVANEITDSEKNLLRFANFTLMFPKMLSGPIERYRDIHTELADTPESIEQIANGLRRFIVGLGKKVLIADVVGKVVGQVFALDSPNIGPAYAWFALVGFAIQLYFDFSGYADMAIGIGQMMGFSFAENFNYPYIAKSVGEFWRRWHITLSSWFRDYIFLPIEISQRRNRRIPQQANLLLIFVLTGLWHGLTLNFVIWGCLFAMAMILESSFSGKWLKKLWTPLQHVWTLGWVLVAWVFFRSPNLLFAIKFFRSLLGLKPAVDYPFSQLIPFGLIDNSTWIALALGILLALPLGKMLNQWISQRLAGRPKLELAWLIVRDVLLMVLLVASVAMIASSGFTPGVYEQF